MLELLRKDFGLCRHVLAGGVIALLVPYLSVIVYTACTTGLSDNESVEFFSLALLGASQTSVWLSLFSIAFLGGFIVAGERRDRSAEFLAFLPPKKSAILCSKALVCVTWMLVVAIVYFAVADFIVPWISDGQHAYQSTARQILLTAAVMFSVFGTSWLFSTMLSSPVLSVLAGLVAPYGLSMIFYVMQLKFGWEFDEATMPMVYTIVHFVFGLTTFLGGWLYYTRRIEP